MIKEIEKITYRGHLKSCNYTCFYCPFSKRTMTKAELEKDKKALYKFINKLESIDFLKPIDLFFTPYGEALIHRHYQKTICDLSKKPFINKIGIQTNLSFDIKSWINEDADFTKIYIWATFHSSMTNIDDFVEKVSVLKEYHNISVGVVGNPKDVAVISSLRAKIPADVYLWINKMDGLGRKYTDEEFNIFSAIDPMFINEFKRKVNKCNAYETDIFVLENGEILNCNRTRKKLGNIYDDDFVNSNICNNKCDCYLAYCHVKDFSDFFGDNYLFRVQKKIKPKAIFFDIDGTLTEDRDVLIKTFEYLSKKTNIYFATELPENIAMKKVGFLKKYISGGVFAGGGLIVDYKNDFIKTNEIINVNKSLNEILNDKSSKIYKNENKIYRILTNKNHIQKHHKYNFCCLEQHNNFVSIIKKDIDKLEGIKEICNLNSITLSDVLAVGNDINDINMLKNCGYSVAVQTSSNAVKDVAKYCMNVSHISFII